MKTVAAVIGRWADIFNYYGLPPITGKKHYQGECPICGRRGKFRIDNKEERGEALLNNSESCCFTMLVLAENAFHPRCAVSLCGLTA